MPLPIGFQGIGDSWRKKKHRLCSYPDDQEKGAAVTTAYPGLPQTVKPSRILSVTG